MKRILEAREEGGGGSRKGGKDEEDSDKLLCSCKPRIVYVSDSDVQ
jgi:hypothetical protein